MTADTSSYNPAMSATWPGLDSVGTLVCDTPKVPCSRTRERRKGASGRGTSASFEISFDGEGSGKDWKALSARSPSPGIFVKLLRFEQCCATYQQKVPIALRVLLDSRRDARACHGQWGSQNRLRKCYTTSVPGCNDLGVSTNAPVYVNKVENHSDEKEAVAPELRHCGGEVK
jgi:hypothetical protein